jgi:hypothetical protein
VVFGKKLKDSTKGAITNKDTIETATKIKAE